MLAKMTFKIIYFDNVAPAVDLRLREGAPLGCQQMIKNTLEQLLIRVCRREDSGISVKTRILPSHSQHHREVIAEKAKDYLHRHYAENVTVEQVASELGTVVEIIPETDGATLFAALVNDTDEMKGEDSNG